MDNMMENCNSDEIMLAQKTDSAARIGGDKTR